MADRETEAMEAELARLQAENLERDGQGIAAQSAIGRKAELRMKIKMERLKGSRVGRFASKVGRGFQAARKLSARLPKPQHGRVADPFGDFFFATPPQRKSSGKKRRSGNFPDWW